MVEYILGNYLVEKGKLSSEQLQQTLEKQDSVRVKLGLIAVAEGMMTLEQTNEVNHLQSVEDRRFGDIAVSKGYLTEEQVTRLLQKQGDTYMTFIQTLVDSGYVAMGEVDGILESFRTSKGYSSSELDAIKSDQVERIVPLFVAEEAKEFEEVIIIAVRTLIRLLDRHVYIGRTELVKAFPSENQVSQAMTGNGGVIDCFSEGDGALLRLACVFGQEEFEGLDMDALDAAGEMLNCINGLYASAQSREGSFLELNPPEYEDVTAKAESTACRVPVYIAGQSLYFTVAKLA